MSKPCIEHQQKGDRDGYGHTSHAGRTNVALHRIAFCKANNVPLESIDGSVVRHTCDNPRCVEGTHLVTGSNYDNVQDRVNRKRCSVKLTEEQVNNLRADYANGGHTHRSLAAKYNTVNSNVTNILNRKTRNHD